MFRTSVNSLGRQEFLSGQCENDVDHDLGELLHSGFRLFPSAAGNFSW